LHISTPAAGGSLVESRTESTPGSSQDNRSNFRIHLSFVQRLMQLLEHAPGDRVERFGSVQCDKYAAPLLFVKNLFVVGHQNSFGFGGNGALEIDDNPADLLNFPSLYYSSYLLFFAFGPNGSG
jgi:hypothetical protein